MKLFKPLSIFAITCLGLSAFGAPTSDTQGYGPLRDGNNQVVSNLTMTFTQPLPPPAVVNGVANGRYAKWAPEKGETWYFVDGKPISYSDYDAHYSGNWTFATRSNKTVCSLTITNDKAQPQAPSGSFTMANPRLWYNGCGYAPSATFSYNGNKASLWCSTTPRAKALNDIFFFAGGCMAGAHTTTLEDMRGAVGGHFALNAPQPVPATARAVGATVADGNTVKTAATSVGRAPAVVTWGTGQQQLK